MSLRTVRALRLPTATLGVHVENVDVVGALEDVRGTMLVFYRLHAGPIVAAMKSARVRPSTGSEKERDDVCRFVLRGAIKPGANADAPVAFFAYGGRPRPTRAKIWTDDGAVTAKFLSKAFSERARLSCHLAWNAAASAISIGCAAPGACAGIQ